MQQCFVVEITNTNGRGHKTQMWAENYKEIEKKVRKEFGVGKNGVGCRLRIVQPDG